MFVTGGDRKTVGSKAFDLYRCVLLGVNVPEFVVVPTDHHATRNEKGSVVRLRDHLEKALVDLGGVVAVRSSSVAEDLGDGSNAGQFKTVLGVDTLSALEDALVEVWRSSRERPMAVIIQRMLKPDIAGVLFTRDPVSGTNKIVIEYVDGLAESLVSGRQDPKRVEVSDQDQQDHGFDELIQISKDLEEAFGYPLDIEWAMCGVDLHILQARPITKLPPPDLTSGPSYSRVHAEEFFSGPVSPLFHSIFNMLYSKYYIGETLEILGIGFSTDYQVLVRHKNYLYADTRLTEYTFSRMPSGPGKRRLMEVLPPDVRDHLVKKKKGLTNPSGIFRLIRFLMANPRFWRSRLDIHFKEDVVPKIIRRLEGIRDLKEMDHHSLMSTYKELIDITVLHIRTSKWGLALYSIPLSDKMGAFLEKNGIGRESMSTLMTGLEDNMTLRATQELKKLADIIKGNPGALEIVRTDLGCYPEFKERLAHVRNGDLIIDHFESILVRYGHRRLSRDLKAPSWRDEPMIPFGIVRTLVGEENAVSPSKELDNTERRKAFQEDIEKRLPLRKRRSFRKLSRYLARYTSFRELQRFYLDMILSRLRDLIMEMARRMVEDGIIPKADDIFFLDMEDIVGFLNGHPGSDLDKKALFNRLGYKDRTTTPCRYMRMGVDFDSIEGQEVVSISGSSIEGQSVSPGAYTGKVRVIADIDGDVEISKGDVIVTRCLDPGQTHFLMRAGALILEVGGMLSHGAILAREMGVPTVAQVKNATGLFHDGQEVFVNGSKGEIVLIDEVD